MNLCRISRCFRTPSIHLDIGFLTPVENRAPGVTQPRGRPGAGIRTRLGDMAEIIGTLDSQMAHRSGGHKAASVSRKRRV